MAKLTDVSIRNAKLEDGQRERSISDNGSGLWLRIREGGRKSLDTVARLNGKQIRIHHGNYPELGLHDARVLHAEAVKQIKQGINPNSVKNDAKKKRQIAEANTFEAVAQLYLDQRPIKALKTYDQKRDILARLVFPTIGSVPIGNIKRSTVTALLDRIDKHNGPVSADRAHTEVSLVLKFHARRDDDYAYPLIAGMRPNSAKQRDRTLSDDEIRAVWNTGDPFCRFLLLTGCRRTEAAGMQWSELSENGTDWLLPASRNKGGVNLVRPLAVTTMALLATLPRYGQYVFGVGKPFTSFGRHAKVIREASGTNGWTFHDLRRTSRTLMSRARCISEHSERCLGHSIGTTVTRTYDQWEYREEKLAVYEALAKLLNEITPSNIVQMRVA